MSDRANYRKYWARLRLMAGPVVNGASLLGLAMIGLVWAGVIYLQKVEYAGAELAAMRTSDNLARAFEKHFSASLDDIDRLLLAMRKSYIEHPKDFKFDAWAPLEELSDEKILLLSIVGPDGIIRLTNSTSNPTPRIDLSGAEHFKKQFHSESDELLISKTVIGRTTGKPSLVMTRRINAINGAFGGIIAASISSEYFTRLYNSVNLGVDGFINITGTDGIIRITDKHNPKRIGLDLSKSDLLKYYHSESSGRFYTEGGTSDRIPRLVTYRQIGKYPLIISIGLSRAEIFATAAAHSRIYNYSAILASILIVAFITFSARKNGALAKMRDQLSAALENMSQGLCMFDKMQRLIVCNKQYAELYGLNAEQIKPGLMLRQILEYRASNGTAPKDHGQYIKDRIAEVTANRPYRTTDKLRDGRYVCVVHRPLGNGGWVATHEDISAQKRNEQDLDETKTFLDSIIANIPVAVVVKDVKSHKFVLVNRAFEETVGQSSSELAGKTVFDIYRAGDAELMDNADRHAIENSFGISANDYKVQTPQLGLRIFSTKRIVIRGTNGDAKYLVVVIDDVTERKMSEQTISFMAHHDALTGLANRVAISQKIQEAATRQRRSGDPFAVLLLDLDRFKQVNDSLGHPAGDALLREVAARLKDALRETDVLGRLGGDEFAIIQSGEVNQRQAAGSLANRVIDIITEPFKIEGNEVNVGASIGIALAPEHATNSDDLLKMADMALYRAKSAGRNSYRFFNSEMSVAANTRHELENDLRRAIQQNEFELHYQPIIDAKTSRICSAEALIRWRHPIKGIIFPDQFIGLAEESGLIVQIGEWVLYRACVDAASWPDHVKVAVNLSPVQFRKVSLPDVVMYALAQSGLPPERLELEITETALIESAAECVPALRKFKNLGITIALDDFGTGYSSLSQLTMFPFDKIKIDKSFTQNMANRADCAAIILAALTLARISI